MSSRSSRTVPPGRTGWRWSRRRSPPASLARCASPSGSLPLALGTPPASRFTSKEVTSDRTWQLQDTTVDEWFGIFMLWCDRKTYDGTDVDRMDDDYHDFFRQDISEGKDDDEDRDIPSVSTFEWWIENELLKLNTICFWACPSLIKDLIIIIMTTTNHHHLSPRPASINPNPSLRLHAKVEGIFRHIYFLERFWT